MHVPCPHDHYFSIGLSTSPLKTKMINIFEGICDCPDFCKNETCEYYDTSRETTKRFCKAACESRTDKGYFKEIEDERRFMEKHGLAGEKDKIYITLDTLPITEDFSSFFPKPRKN